MVLSVGLGGAVVMITDGVVDGLGLIVVVDVDVEVNI